jgi:hypothetical protein
MNRTQKILRFFLRLRRQRWFKCVQFAVLVMVGVASMAFIFLSPSQVSAQTMHTTTSAGVRANSPCPTLPQTCPKVSLPKGNTPPTYSADPTGTGLNCTWFPNAGAADKNIVTPSAPNNTLFITTSCDLTADLPVVSTLWKWALGVVDIFIAFTLMLKGIRIMLAGSVFRYADAVETLPGTITALVAAQASMVIVVLVLNLNNALSYDLMQSAQNIQYYATGVTTKDCNNLARDAGHAGSAINNATNFLNPLSLFGLFNNPVSNFVNNIPGKVGDVVGCDLMGNNNQWSQTLQTSGEQIPEVNDGNPQSLAFAFSSLYNLVEFVAGILSLALLAQMIIRVFFIDFYIILSPLGLACWAMPGRVGESLTRSWLKGFISVVMVQFLQVLALIVIRLGNGILITQLYNMMSYNPDQTHDTTLLWVMVVAQLWFVFRIPALLGATTTSMMVDFGQKIGQVATTAASEQVQETMFVASMATQMIGSAAGAAIAA